MNSILLIDKPVGHTSSDTVNELKRILKIKKIGHSGTLDKSASGLLVVCTGWATKLTRYFLESDKRYIGTVKLGIVTDTCDSDGNILESNIVQGLNAESIRKITAEFMGEISQFPPIYSALKIRGRRASDIARKGDLPVLDGRKINIKKLDILKIDLDNSKLTIDVTCSKGTYIRALARDIGEFLGTGAYLESLRRVASGNFIIENAATIDEVREFVIGNAVEKNFTLRPEEALSYFSSIVLKNIVRKQVFNGAFFNRDDIISIDAKAGNTFIILDEEKNLIAIADIDIDNWMIKYLNVFNQE